MNNDKAKLIFIILSLSLLAGIGMGITYFKGYKDGGNRVIELVNESDRVEIHIIRIGETEIGRDTIVRRGAGGIRVVKGKFY